MRGQSAEEIVVFAFSYAAKDILAYARGQGWLTVLGQIDSGPRESEIVLREYAKLGLSPGPVYQPPPGYWNDWREECELADRIVVNSSWSARCLVERGVPAAKLRVIPCAFEPDEAMRGFVRKYPPAFTERNPLEILFLGRTTILKGIHLLMDAARSLLGRPVHFTVVGKGLDHPQLEIPPNVKWVGPVPSQETQVYYRQADALVLPTFCDGFALVQLEAMAWALPVIATSRCGDVVQDGVNGVLLPEVSSAALVEAISILMHSPEKLQAMSAKAKVADRFSLEAVGESLLATTE